MALGEQERMTICVVLVIRTCTSSPEACGAQACAPGTLPAAGQFADAVPSAYISHQIE
jgi:hypothetical protein